MPSSRAAFAVLLAAPLLLAGCQSLLNEGTTSAAGIAGAGVASAVTKNATVGAAIGLGVKSLADVGLAYAERRVHGAEQDAIAQAAGPLPEGGVRAWSISHDVPIEEDEHGQVTVARNLGAGNFVCKEIVFSVERGGNPPLTGFYTATICRDGAVWKWASAEPATARWGGLQ